MDSYLYNIIAHIVCDVNGNKQANMIELGHFILWEEYPTEKQNAFLKTVVPRTFVSVEKYDLINISISHDLKI